MSAGAAEQRLHHRLGQVAEISSTSDKRSPQGRVWRYTHALVRWKDLGEGEGEPQRIDLIGEYQTGDGVAVVRRGEAQICDVNLRTGKASPIGDRVEGLAAIIMFIAMPLNFVLIGLPFYFGVRLWSRMSTSALRKRVAAYIEMNILRGVSGGQTAMSQPASP
jgi:hypothetical protein